MVKKQHIFFRKTGLFLSGFGLLSAYLAFISAFRGIGVGIWPQSETMTALLHASSFVCALGLICTSLAGGAVSSFFKSPLVFVPGLMGLLSLFLLPFQELPVRSILGGVRTGEGAVWWLDISVLTACAMLLWRFSFWRKLLIFFAVGSFTVCFVLSVSHDALKHYISPFYFTDYLALPLLCLLPLAYRAWSKYHTGRFFYIGAYVVLNGLLLLTQNKAMVGFGLLVPLFFAGLWAFTRQWPEWQKRLSVSALVSIPVVCIFIFAIVSALAAGAGYYAFTGTGAFETVASRAYLVDVSFQSQVHSPITFLTGYGWGSYVDHLARFQPSEWLDFTDFLRAQWDGLTFDHFHSHNMFVETLNAVGVIGCVLLLAYFLSFAIFARGVLKKAAIIQSAGLMVWGSLWFVLPIHLPFLVFAAASTCRSTAIKGLRGVKTPRLVFIVVLLGVACLQAVAGFMVISTARMAHDYDPEALSIVDINEKCPNYYDDFGAGGLHLSRIMLDRLRYTIDLTDTENEGGAAKEKPDAIPGHIASMNSLFCQSQRYVQERNASSRLLVARLMMRGELLLALFDYADKGTRAYYYEGWEADLKAWLLDNPNRTDLASPYLLYHVIHQQEERSQEVVDLIRDLNPEDPIGLWFKGLSLLVAETTAPKGLRMMRKALEFGIERFVPVETSLKEMLLNQ